MLQHYYTLFHVAAELDVLRGCVLSEAYTQFKGTAFLQFEDHERTGVVECSFDPHLSAIFLKPRFARARRNSMDLFKSLIGLTLQSVSIPPNERIITFNFGTAALHCAMFHGGRGNMLVTDADGSVVDAFMTPFSERILAFVPDGRTARALADMPPNLRLDKALTTSLLLSGRPYQQELAQRLNIDLGKSLDSYTAEDLNKIERCAADIRSACLGAEHFYLQTTGEETPLLSMIPLSDDVEEFDGISEAILQRIIRTRRLQRDRGKRSEIETLLNKLDDKTGRALANLESEKIGAERAAQRRLYAEMIMARGDLHKKGLDEIVLEDWENTEHTIPLDPAKSLLENAEQYFDRARKSMQAAAIREKRFFQYLERQERLASARAAFNAAQTDEELDAFRNNFADLFPPMRKDRNTIDESRYRSFDLGEGFMLYVGRNSANNDELTMRFARPNDYWFHARGVSGSHAVLKGGDGKSKPPKYVLEQAAGIAAYYSKARNAGLTPVVYTQKKYIRKPRGAAQGAVALERETVIMTRPSIPEGGDED